MKKILTFAFAAMALIVAQGVKAQNADLLATADTKVTTAPPRYVIDNALNPEELALANDLWWKNREREYLRQLGSKDPQKRSEAIRGIIWFTTLHKQDVHFKNACTQLFDIYLFDRDERVQRMALAALAQLDDENVMRNIAYYNARITSPKLRKAMQSALTTHYRKAEVAH